MTMKYLIKGSKQNKNKSCLEVEICNTFYSKLLGLMFRKNIQPNEGIILIQDKPSRINTAIHMFFMNFDIAVFWLDENNIVVDKLIAKKWHPFYMPKNNAIMVIESHPSNLEDFTLGETLYFEEN